MTDSAKVAQEEKIVPERRWMPTHTAIKNGTYPKIGVEHVLLQVIEELWSAESAISTLEGALTCKNETVIELSATLSTQNEEMRVMRDALEAGGRILRGAYLDWQYAGGPDECEHGIAQGILCQTCDRFNFFAALAQEQEGRK